MILLPTSPDPDYTQTIVIDGVSYDIRLQWNVREEAWYMYLGLAGIAPVLKTKVVNGWDILKPFKYLIGTPQGGLFTIDTVAVFGRITRDELVQLGRFNLVYLTVDELAAL